MNFLLVGVGGMLGAMARYGMSLFLLNYLQKPFSFFNVLLINLIGCFGIGFLNGLDTQFLKPEVRLLLVTGVLGGFTTYSAFGFETFEFLNARHFALAFSNIALHIFGGIVAVWCGNAAAKSF